MPESKSSQNHQVKELCLRLKPILGADMDQIYTAYCLEDPAGKEQIERYLELLAIRHLPSALEPDPIQLLPPSREQAAGEYPLGMVCYAGKELYPFGLREEDWIQHVAILGRSGAGKTNTGFIILRELQAHGKPFLLFDWKRNYRDLLALPEFQEVEIYTIGRDIAPFTFNPLIPPAGTDPKTWMKKLNEVIAHAYCLGNGVLFLLQQAVDAVYEEAGVYEGNVLKWPTFKDVLLKARNMDTRGREAGWLSSTLRALATLCFGEMDKLLNTDNNKSVDHLLDKSVILELDALTQSDKTFFVQTVMLYLHGAQIQNERREEFQRCIIIEEAHHVLSDERRSLVGGQSMMEIIFREIREMGISLILLDQHPSKISLSALGNTNCSIAMNLKHRSDINAMAQCLLLDKDRDILGTLSVGEAVVKLQNRYPWPFQVKIPVFPIKKGKITDDLIRAHMSTPASEGCTNSITQDPLFVQSAGDEIPNRREDKALELLQDIVCYPASGIASRYQRLGISVRQGQKWKNLLVEKKWIAEQLETIRGGRIRLLRITEKGRAILSQGEE